MNGGVEVARTYLFAGNILQEAEALEVVSEESCGWAVGVFDRTGCRFS